VAAQHYLDHDRRLAGTLKALGYPCRDTLAAWLNELHPETRKRVVGKARSVPRPQALKQAAVIELCTRQTSAQVIAQKLAVSRPTLYQWKNQLLGPEAPASMTPNNDSPSDPERAELERQVESLRRDVQQLQLEHDILKKANELLKKNLDVDLPLLSNQEKTRLVDALKQLYSLSELSAALGLPRSSYFYHRARLRCADKYVVVRGTIADIFELNHRCYGYRRI
jgi:transposase-like protein